MTDFSRCPTYLHDARGYLATLKYMDEERVLFDAIEYRGNQIQPDLIQANISTSRAYFDASYRLVK